jgi:hypothetical protein
MPAVMMKTIVATNPKMTTRSMSIGGAPAFGSLPIGVRCRVPNARDSAQGFPGSDADRVRLERCRKPYEYNAADCP